MAKVGMGLELISAERMRQIHQEGWTTRHDDQHTDESLAQAAAVYATPLNQRKFEEGSKCPDNWPMSWHQNWYKPTPNDRIKELTKAGALIAAELDRLIREQQSKGKELASWK